MRKRLMGIVSAVVAGSAVLITTGAHALAAEPAAPPAPSAERIDALPAPFADWNVSLSPKVDEPGALLLSYDSPALGQRSDNTVYLPTSYSETGAKSPTLYYLHGTVVSALDNPVTDPVAAQESLLEMVGSGGGDKQTKLQGFAEQRDQAQFVVVAPDTNAQNSWCESCLWIDGQRDLLPEAPPVTAKTVPAETVLYQELIPLTEQVLNVRTDRGGRGISGFSMGAVGALIQAFRHPDRFAYTAAISGPYDFVDDTFWRNWVDVVGYMRDQGYGVSVTDLPRWRNFNPADLVGNFAGSGSPLMISAGDVCAPPTDAAGAEDCADDPALRNPAASLIESQMRRNNDEHIADIANAGVEAKQVRYSGIHGAYNHRIYPEVIVPGANAAFAAEPVTTDSFGYRTQDRTFSVWGYDVAAEHTDTQFLALENARHDGHAFSLRGTGVVDALTPASFTAGQTYRVSYSSAAGQNRTEDLTADPQGRLRLDVDLDDPAYATKADALALFGHAPGYARIEVTQA
ncbi:Putative esterase [Pseudonocardia ammonioxydans]|uniref:Putative esterase n=1 Tax=Pseudonocardia ammonioxydans TaxID=260086 RepID=A0A1I5FVT6_PSUAM|nr:alpha/beta hydrolase-fold protein [Pseudonocardia ammonioxydans]SFO27759.1 Putative esterase [Pseudonocardia ammonioxydans]